MTRMKLFRNLLALASALCLSTAFAVGAIAVDDEEGDEEPGYGFSSGHDDKAEASKAAMKEAERIFAFRIAAAAGYVNGFRSRAVTG